MSTFPKGAHLHSPVIQKPCHKKLLELIQERPYTVAELCRILDRTDGCISGLLRKSPAHICAWVPQRNTYAAQWAYGEGTHAVRPRKGESKSGGSNTRKADEMYLRKPYVTGARVWGI